MKTDSFRGITLTSMVAKVLEFLLLNRLETVFVEAGLPHIKQSAYRHAVSCKDAVLLHRKSFPSTSEVVVMYIYMCLYYLQAIVKAIAS